MKPLRFFNLSVLLLGALASQVHAQTNHLVSIKNTSGEKRKICMYRGNDQVSVVAYKCFELNTGEQVMWNREEDYSTFKVKIFKPAFLDKYLYTRTLPGNTTIIIMGEGKRFGFSRREVKPPTTKYILKVCNRQYDYPVYFTLGFQTNTLFVTEGWWSVKKGQCFDMPVSDRLNQKWKVPYGSLPRTYFYAKVTKPKTLIWHGGESDYNLCINEKRAYTKTQFVVDPSGQSQRIECSGDGETRVRFRRLDDPKTNETYYYLTF